MEKYKKVLTKYLRDIMMYLQDTKQEEQNNDEIRI